MKKELISIIIPIYNAENYIESCKKCIENQTYDNLEIILVDDGSKDKSLELCNLWKKQDERVIVLHQNNLGVSSARNFGLKVYKGDYVAFLDCDDKISDDYFEFLYLLIKEHNVDVSSCSSINIYSDGTKKQFKQLDYEGTLESSQIVSLVLQSKLVTVWGILFKREVIGNNNLFPKEITIREEVPFLINIFMNKNFKLYLSQEIKYFYFQNSESITKTLTLKKLEDQIKLCNIVKKIIKDEYKEDYFIYKSTAFYTVASKSCNKKEANDIFNICLIYLKNNYFNILKCKNIRKDVKKKVKLLVISPLIFKAMKKYIEHKAKKKLY